MANASRIARHSVTIACVVVSALAVYNVFSDNADVKKLAEQTACDRPGCAISTTRIERSPIGQSFGFQTAPGASNTVSVTCRRTLFLVGEYRCARD